MKLDQLREELRAVEGVAAKSVRVEAGKIRDAGLRAARSGMRRLQAYVVVELALNVVATVGLVAFLASSRDVRFVAPAVVLAGFAFTHVVFGARQLAALQRLDFGASVVLVQRELERLRVGRIRMTKWTILLGPLLWIPLLVVVLRGFFGIDTYAVFDRTWIVVNLLFGVAYVPFMLVVSKRLADRFEGSPLLRRVLRDIAGRNLSAAHGFMSELARLEAADAPP
jgi:hypothetical protein